VARTSELILLHKPYPVTVSLRHEYQITHILTLTRL
ncbi:uncharacterized protein METZ01_LOCUS282161, partial [marine metagenome]